jgi:hypothetical protein
MHRLVVALTTLLALTAGTYVAAYVFLFSGASDRAAGLVPDDATAYARVYLQPSAGQQANLSDLIGRLPGFADEATLDDKIDEIVQNLLAGAGLDYRGDLKPWLGDQVAVATWPDAEDPDVQRMVAIVDVTDSDAMSSALADLAARQGVTFTEESHDGAALHVSSTTTWALVDEMLVVSDTADPVRAVIDTSAGGPSLGSRPEFVDAMASIPADHLAAAYVDLARLAAGGGEDAAGTHAFGPVAAALIAEPDGIRVAAVVSRGADAGGPSGQPIRTANDASTLAAWMHAETVAQVVVRDLAAILTDAESAAAGTAIAEQLNTVRAALAFGFGLDLDADVLPLLDGETALVIDNLAGGVPAGQLLLRPLDFDAAAGALARISDALVEAGGSRSAEEVNGVQVTLLDVPTLGRVAYATDDDVIILGLTAEDVTRAADVHDGDLTLATNERYEAAFEAIGGRTGHEAWADVPRLLEQLGIAETLPEDARAILAQLGTLAATTRMTDDSLEFHAVLTVEDDSAD